LEGVILYSLISRTLRCCTVLLAFIG